MSREKRDGSFVRKRQEGSAMVVVMCVMLITTILCLELLLAASASARNIRRIGERTQCRVNAYSVSGVLIDEITGAPEYGDVTEDGALREDGNSTLWYIFCFLNFFERYITVSSKNYNTV